MIFSINYPYEYLEVPTHGAYSDPRVKGFVEGYASALADMMRVLTGEGPHGKIYDPMTVSEGFFISYAFDMKDGGRSHPFSDYEDIGDVCHTLRKEAVDWIGEG